MRATARTRSRVSPARWDWISARLRRPRRRCRSWPRCWPPAAAARAARCRARAAASIRSRWRRRARFRLRTALIADIHGNIVALEAVLADIGRRDVDAVVCLGDVAATGPQPAEAVDRIA